MLSAEQNDGPCEEIIAIDESQTENGPVLVQEAEMRFRKFLWSAILLVVLSGRLKDKSRCSPTVPLR